MTSPPELAPNLQRALASQYRIERELGRGGMGVVYLARDLTLDRLVAVKVIHPDLSANRTVVARFLAEARAIAKLRHPNIVAVHAAGEVDGQLYFVMDYLAGETLRDRLRREGRLEPATAVRIASDIAEALDQASVAGIVHRDLKPENILLEGTPGEPNARLADFGIARLTEGAGGDNTGPGAVMGTPAYMSPEQAAGEDLDGRSDLYSLGIVTYEMLTGKTPFSGPHRTVISKQILDPPRSVSELQGDVPDYIGGAVMRALEKVPEARWPTGKSFRQALANQPSTPVAPAPSRVRLRSKSPWAVGLAAAAVLLIGILWTTLRRNGPPAGIDPRHSILVLPFDNLRDDRSFDWLREGSVNMLTLSLSQWQDLTVVDQDRIHDLVSKQPPGDPIGLKQAIEMARASRAWTVVLGDFSRVGDSLHLVARRYDVASGQRLDIVQVDGLATAEDVRPLYDRLAAKLLDLTGAPQSNRASLASVTTKSVDAYRSYLQGVDALNHWRLNDASAALETAVRLDPNFSLANYKLAVTRGWVSAIDTLGLAAIRRASRSAERLPPRDRQLIDGYLAFVEGDYDRGLDLYSQLIRRDSTDVEAWYGWADAAFHGGYARGQPAMLSKSLRGFRRVIELDSAFALAYEHAGALLTDAGQRAGWLRLVGTDSLIFAKTEPDSAVRRVSQQAAQREAVSLARAWTQIQPNTPRAHYHLYKAYLTGGRVNEARQTVGLLRALFPDSSQPFFGFLDARAQLVGGDIEGSARTVKSVLSKVDPTIFRDLDFAPEPIFEVMAGVDALGYFGDVEDAANVIKLGRAMYQARPEQRDSLEKARADELWELSRLGLLFGATGTRLERLRSLTTRGITLVRGGTEKERQSAPETIGGAAVGLLLGPSGDTTALAEIDRLTARQSPAAIRALIAARAGDSTRATALLVKATTPSDSTTFKTEWRYPFDDRPIVAEAYFELGKYLETVQTLASFSTGDFMTRGLDSRWILLPRVRLLRGQALEQLGRIQEAAIEFRAVVDQWSGGDAELRPFVQEAQRGLARVAGVAQAQ